jgi:hypothetical protein
MKTPKDLVVNAVGTSDTPTAILLRLLIKNVLEEVAQTIERGGCLRCRVACTCRSDDVAALRTLIQETT